MLRSKVSDNRNIKARVNCQLPKQLIGGRHICFDSVKMDISRYFGADAPSVFDSIQVGAGASPEVKVDVMQGEENPVDDVPDAIRDLWISRDKSPNPVCTPLTSPGVLSTSDLVRSHLPFKLIILTIELPERPNPGQDH